MEVPYGIKNAENMMCQLNKAIYGLKQAGRERMVQDDPRGVHEDRVPQLRADQCVYVKGKKDKYVYVCLYVDDMIIAVKNTTEINEVKTALKSAFKMKELGEAKFILGMKIDHNRTAGSLMIKQTRYVDDVVKRFNQEHSKTVLSRFLDNPGQQHWKAAIRVLRYLKSTKEYGIIYDANNGKVKLEAFTDADWGSNLDDRRSVSGIMVLIGGAPVVFKSKYQCTVALSSAEAEYMALSLCTQEVLWARAMLKDLGHGEVEATQVWEDNQGAIALASNAVYNARTKHVDIRHHFILENVAKEVIKVDYVGTEDQLADMLMKGLGTKRLKYLLEASRIRTKAAQH
ncbi:hypothetical protein PC129_g17098 [Phytophthora cactorum]|nr:hypothetical protein PC114_g25379 [Phytophthora cactorum]KAG2965464.1 hypothetical protein PC119_g24984 [Phytophthora cactorum]KAG3211934.1 hypothetical protein PC129_g17098 [Phytophthora cactorum]